MNLLVVDPDTQTALQIRRLLGESGDGAIEAAQSGTDAWMMLGGFRDRFDAVVLEPELPDIDGLELLARMRRSPKHRDVPVLICSSRLHRDVLAKMMALGIRHFVVKPAPDAVLLEKLGDLIGTRLQRAMV